MRVASVIWLYLLFRIAHHVVFLFAEAHILSSLDFNSGCGIVLSSQISETRSPQQNSDKARAKVSQWLHLLQSLVAPTCEGLCLARALQPHSASSVAPDPGGGAAFTSQQWGYIFRYTTWAHLRWGGGRAEWQPRQLGPPPVLSDRTPCLLQHNIFYWKIFK